MPADIDILDQFVGAESSIGDSEAGIGLIASLDLFRLAKRLVSEDGLKDTDFALRVIEEYKRFFFLTAQWNEEDQEWLQGVFLPPPGVDLVWQRHMLDTAIYFDDCERFSHSLGYLHRHELRSRFGHVTDSSVLTVKEDCCIDASAAYKRTIDRYTLLYGSSPPADIWPPVISDQLYTGARKVDGAIWLSYASPFVHLAYKANNDDELFHSEEETLVPELMWVGHLVYDALPLKQVKCKKGETLTQISFPVVGSTREESVRAVVKEYARFLLLILRNEKAEADNVTFATAEITPSKIVDELWHAHILRSPSYMSFW